MVFTSLWKHSGRSKIDSYIYWCVFVQFIFLAVIFVPISKWNFSLEFRRWKKNQNSEKHSSFLVFIFQIRVRIEISFFVCVCVRVLNIKKNYYIYVHRELHTYVYVCTTRWKDTHNFVIQESDVYILGK